MLHYTRVAAPGCICFYANLANPWDFCQGLKIQTTSCSFGSGNGDCRCSPARQVASCFSFCRAAPFFDKSLSTSELLRIRAGWSERSQTYCSDCSSFKQESTRTRQDKSMCMNSKCQNDNNLGGCQRKGACGAKSGGRVSAARSAVHCQGRCAWPAHCLGSTKVLNTWSRTSKTREPKSMRTVAW